MKEFEIKTTSSIIPTIMANGDNLRAAIDDSIADITRAVIGYPDPVISVADMLVTANLQRLPVHPENDEPAYFSLEVEVKPPQSKWVTAEGMWWDKKFRNREAVKRVFLVLTDDESEMAT
jgi:hypothetical protein